MAEYATWPRRYRHYAHYAHYATTQQERAGDHLPTTAWRIARQRVSGHR
jgi:hypothetical protein